MATNFGVRDNNGNPDVFVHDRLTGDVELISVGLDGAPGEGRAPSISADGRFVAFTSFGDTHVAGDTNFTDDIFVRDRQTGTTEGISTIAPSSSTFLHSTLNSITPDGRFVGFTSAETNLVPRDTNDREDAFLFDRETDTVQLVSRNSRGVQGDRESSGTLVGADGTVVVFASSATNLVRDDTNEQTDERIAADDELFGFAVFANDITPDARIVALSTRADLLPEQDVGFFASDVYTRSTCVRPPISP